MSLTVLGIGYFIALCFALVFVFASLRVGSHYDELMRRDFHKYAERRDKPRMYQCSEGLWCCYSPGTRAYGATPFIAYDTWKAAFDNE